MRYSVCLTTSTIYAVCFSYFIKDTLQSNALLHFFCLLLLPQSLPHIHKTSITICLTKQRNLRETTAAAYANAHTFLFHNLWNEKNSSERRTKKDRENPSLGFGLINHKKFMSGPFIFARQRLKCLGFVSQAPLSCFTHRLFQFRSLSPQPLLFEIIYMWPCHVLIADWTNKKKKTNKQTNGVFNFGCFVAQTIQV